MRQAEEVTFYGDEDGWVMQVLDSQGETFLFNIHGIAADVMRNAGDIGKWLDEGRASAASHVPLSREDLEAYPFGDPKRVSLERELEARGL